MILLILLFIICGVGGWFIAVSIFDLIFGKKEKITPIHYHYHLSITNQSVTIDKETITRNKFTSKSKTTTTI